MSESLDERVMEMLRIFRLGDAYDLINDLHTALKESEAENAKFRDALEEDCGGKCNAEYNPCWARELLDEG